MKDIEKYRSGHFEKGFGYKFFVPELINDEWSWRTPIINKLLEKAAIKLGELNSFARLVANIGFYGSSYFWRTQQQQEIDYIEEVDGKISAFEFKWNPNKKSRFPLTFTKNYNPRKTEIIHRDNFESFLL